MAKRTRTRVPETTTLYGVLPPRSPANGRAFARIVNLLLFHYGPRHERTLTLFDDRAGDYQLLGAMVLESGREVIENGAGSGPRKPRRLPRVDGLLIDAVSISDRPPLGDHIRRLGGRLVLKYELFSRNQRVSLGMLEHYLTKVYKVSGGHSR